MFSDEELKNASATTAEAVVRRGKWATFKIHIRQDDTSCFNINQALSC
jgi:hypothetical protein